MHKLARPPAPGCLSKYRHGRENWGNVSSDDKLAIWRQIEAMQGRRCAYCEDALQNGNRHIDHFYQKSKNPKQTFQWDNLFGSCNKPKSCGKQKDRQRYDPADLIKPDADDPEEYLQFISDGRIVARNGLHSVQQRKADETLRVLNLDHDRGPLRQMRRSAVAGYLQQAENLAEFAKVLEPEEFDEYKREELAAISDLPFATSIKHVLITYLP